MNISVISPIGHSGTTTVTFLMAQALAHTQTQRVMLTYTGTSRRICEYIGLSVMDDKTRSISQVVELLESHAIGEDDLYDYSVKIYPNLNIMDTADESITEEDGTKLMSFVFQNIPADITICDVSTEIYDEVTIDLFDKSDILAVVIEPTVQSYKALINWMQSVFWPKKKEVMIIVNRYCEEIDALRNISKQIGVAHLNVCKVHQNPYLVKASNSGEGLTVLPWVLEKDPRVIELNNDLKEICQYIMSKTDSRFKWEG